MDPIHTPITQPTNDSETYETPNTQPDVNQETKVQQLEEEISNLNVTNNELNHTITKQQEEINTARDEGLHKDKTIASNMTHIEGLNELIDQKSKELLAETNKKDQLYLHIQDLSEQIKQNKTSTSESKENEDTGKLEYIISS